MDVCPGGHEIQDGKRRGRIGYKRAVQLSQSVPNGKGVRTQRVKGNEISIKRLKMVG